MLINLNKTLRANGVDLSRVLGSGQYIVHDADEVLTQLIHDGELSLEKFEKIAGSIISMAAGRGKPIHVFGEMVTILLRQGNFTAVTQLEDAWNRLIAQYPLSLYCAYAEHDFNSSAKHQQLFQTICDRHAIAS